MTIISEAHKDFDTRASVSEKKAVAMAAIAAKLNDDQTVQLGMSIGVGDNIRAKYKIEVMFAFDRKTNEPNKCLLSVWESGKKLHGGGDESAFWCRDARRGFKGGCGGVILNKFVRNGVAICPRCKQAINAQFLSLFRPVEKTHTELAHVLERIFRHLECNADVYLKFYKTDPRYIEMKKAFGELHAAKHKGLHIYPLKNILKDTEHGTSLASRFEAFLKA